MKVEEVLALVNAGYTKEEIVAMEATPEPEKKPEPAPEPEKKPELTPEPEKKPEPAPEPANNQVAELTQQMSKLIATLQANAIASSSLTPQHQPSAEDALAEIIRPTFKER